MNGITHQREEPVSTGRLVRESHSFLYSESVKAIHGAMADGASDLFRDIFTNDRLPVRTVIGVSSLPLGVPVIIEVVFEVTT